MNVPHIDHFETFVYVSLFNFKTIGQHELNQRYISS